MPSTHLSLHYHIIFSTKDRHPFITDDWRSRLHEYLGGLIRAAEGIPEAIGGYGGSRALADRFESNAYPGGARPRHQAIVLTLDP